MNDMVPYTHEREMAKSMSDSQLFDQIKSLLAYSAENMLKLAVAIGELESRGRDLSDLKIDLIVYLRLIACGRLLPEAVVYFRGSKRILKHVANLSHTDQASLAKGDKVKLVVFGPDGQTTYRMKDPWDMSPKELVQAFGEGVIRNETAQLSFLDDQRKEVRKNARKSTESVGILSIDRDRGGVVLTGKRGDFISLADLKKAVRAFSR